jgi:hypothetical protein
MTTDWSTISRNVPEVIAAKTSTLQKIIILVESQLSECLEALNEYHDTLVADSHATDGKPTVANICSRIASKPALEEVFRLAEDLIETEHVSSSPTATSRKVTNTNWPWTPDVWFAGEIKLR